MLTNAKLQTIICSTCLTKSRDFYGRVLGLAVIEGSEQALIFNVGSSDLRLAPVSSMTPSEHTVVGFAVDNLSAVVAKLKDTGVQFVKFLGFPHDDDGVVTTPDGSRVVWFQDPDGNILSAVQFLG